MKGIVKKGRIVPANTVRIITGRLGGKWLTTLGFRKDDVLTVDTAPGIITYQRHENGIARTVELVKFARQNKLKLIQVKMKGHELFIEIPKTCLKQAGIAPDETLYAIYTPDLLQLQHPDLS